MTHTSDEQKEDYIPRLVFLNEIIKTLPADLHNKRMMMPAKKGFLPGLRGAAKDAGVSLATYQRAENGNNIDIKTLRKLLKWIGY